MPVADADADEEDEVEVEEEEDGGAVVLDEDVREGEVVVLVDVNGFEKVVAMDVGNVRDVLVEASAQNCSAMDSTEERSPEHPAETHATSCVAKLDELGAGRRRAGGDRAFRCARLRGNRQMGIGWGQGSSSTFGREREDVDSLRLGAEAIDID